MQIRIIVTILFFIFVGLQLFAVAMNLPLNHDEHQFIASGYLLAKQASLPYLHYPYFQMPNLVFLYAFLPMLTDHMLLGARTISVVATLLILVVLHQQMWRTQKQQGTGRGLFAACGIVLLLLFNPVFSSASLLSWNHAVPLLFAVLATLQLVKTLDGDTKRNTVFWSGVYLSLAIGTRISFGALILPFLLFLLLQTKLSIKVRSNQVLWFGIGGILAGIPTLFFWMAQPEVFWFDVVGYHLEIDRLYFQTKGGAMSKQEIGQQFIQLIFNYGNEYLTWTIMGIGAAILSMQLKNRQPMPLRCWFVLSLIPFVLSAAFSKVIAFHQYYLAPLPFVMLALIYGIAALKREQQRFLGVVVGVAGSIMLIHFFKPLEISKLQSPEDWNTIRIHQEGEGCVAALKGREGKILSLSPLWAMEGGFDIYEAFATGPFAWRTAEFVEESMRQKIKMVGTKELSTLWAADRPIACLTGMEGLEDKRLKSHFTEPISDLLIYSEKEMWLFDPLPHKVIANIDFEAVYPDSVLVQENDKKVYYVAGEYSPSIHFKAKEKELQAPITLRASSKIKLLEKAQKQLFLVIDVRKKGKSKLWKRLKIDTEELGVEQWASLGFSHFYSTADLAPDDEIVVCLWNPSKIKLLVEELQLAEIK